MPSVNKVIIVGHLGHDPEMRNLPSGEAVATLAVATTDTWKDKDGAKQEATEWHRVVFFGRQAEVCGQYLKKGSLAYIEGSLRTRKWQDKNGNGRYVTEIRGDRMQMLNTAGKKADEQVGAQAVNMQAEACEAKTLASTKPSQKSSFADMEDDVPF